MNQSRIGSNEREERDLSLVYFFFFLMLSVNGHKQLSQLFGPRSIEVQVIDNLADTLQTDVFVSNYPNLFGGEQLGQVELQALRGLNTILSSNGVIDIDDKYVIVASDYFFGSLPGEIEGKENPGVDKRVQNVQDLLLKDLVLTVGFSLNNIHDSVLNGQSPSQDLDPMCKTRIGTYNSFVDIYGGRQRIDIDALLREKLPGLYGELNQNLQGNLLARKIEVGIATKETVYAHGSSGGERTDNGGQEDTVGPVDAQPSTDRQKRKEKPASTLINPYSMIDTGISLELMNSARSFYTHYYLSSGINKSTVQSNYIDGKKGDLEDFVTHVGSFKSSKTIYLIIGANRCGPCMGKIYNRQSQGEDKEYKFSSMNVLGCNIKNKQPDSEVVYFDLGSQGELKKITNSLGLPPQTALPIEAVRLNNERITNKGAIKKTYQGPLLR